MLNKASTKSALTLLFFVLVCLSLPRLRIYALGELLEGRTFSSDVVWYDPIMARYWLFDALAFFAIGLVIAMLWRRKQAFLVAIAFSALYVVWWYSRQTIMFVMPPEWYTYVWNYGGYTVPVAASIFGCWIYLAARARVTRG